MGCCFSCDEDKTYQDADVNEHSRLLSNPVSDGPSNRPMPSYNTSNPPTQQKGDEQSALNRILQQTASDVIDVSAIDTQAMEQYEYMDRARQYTARLGLACNSAQKLPSALKLPNGVAAPMAVLASPPPPLTDVQLVITSAEQVSRAIEEVRVKHKEDLVVPFGVP